jgi:hypothetical protein
LVIVGRHLAAAHAHPSLGKDMVSLAAELKSQAVVLDWFYKPFRDELIKHGLSVCLQVYMRTFKQITKHRNFEIGEFFCHLMCAARNAPDW